MNVSIGLGWVIFVLAAIAAFCLDGKHGLGMVCAVVAGLLLFSSVLALLLGGTFK